MGCFPQKYCVAYPHVVAINSWDHIKRSSDFNWRSWVVIIWFHVFPLIKNHVTKNTLKNNKYSQKLVLQWLLIRLKQYAWGQIKRSSDLNWRSCMVIIRSYVYSYTKKITKHLRVQQHHKIRKRKSYQKYTCINVKIKQINILRNWFYNASL